MAKFDLQTKLRMAIQNLETARDFTSKTKIARNLDHAIEKLESAKRILEEIKQNGYELKKIHGSTPALIIESLLLGFRNIKINIGFAGLHSDIMHAKIGELIELLKKSQ